LVVASVAVAVSFLGIGPAAFGVDLENVELAGKAIHKIEKEGDLAVEVFAIQVKSATAKDGQRIVELKGKTVAITGPKIEEIEKHNGKEVLAFGTLSLDKKALEADSVIRVPPAKTPPDKEAPAPSEPLREGYQF
jgi:hypothetical protein